MLSLAEATGAPWLACARNLHERRLARDQGGVTVAPDDRPPVTMHYVDPGPRRYSMYYSTIANPLLWFLQHYLWDLAREPMIGQSQYRAWSSGYVTVNRLMAERLAELAGAGRRPPLVLTQDYHLYLLPRFLRQRVPEIILQHFIHVPWPTAEYWKVLPEEMRRAIYDGLLANDVIGFQTGRDARRFLIGCEELLGLRTDHQEGAVLHRGRVSWVRSYPISVDVAGLRQLAASPEVLSEDERIRGWRKEMLIVRVDRTDPSKNILRGFAAYELLLRRHPELRGRVQFWAFLQPSRQDVPAYRAYLRSIKETVARVNREFRSAGWQPIRLEIAEDIHRAVAAYRAFDVLLVNSIYDGMNLVAKEGSLLNRRQGVLVLSENVGAWEELGSHAITVNPFDVDATASALHQALTMRPQERARRAAELRSAVIDNDIVRWVERQFRDLNELATQPTLRLH